MTVFTTLLRTLRTLLAQLIGTLFGLATNAARFVEHWLLDSKKALYGLAVTRILIGIVGMGTLAANWSTRFYSWGGASAWTGQPADPSSDFPNIFVFSLFQHVRLDPFWFSAAYIGLFLLAFVVTIGWRTKFVLPVYLVTYVGFIELNGMLSDQGDNIYRMLMIYLLFADTTARLSIDARRRTKSRPARVLYARRLARFRPYNNLFNNLVLVVVTLHVSFIYMSGALYKAQGQTWANGYAIFNPLHTARFSSWPELADLITSFGPLAVTLSWGTIIIQMMFLPLLMRRPTRIVGLMAIFGFHAGIAIFMGLPFFSLAMIAIDMIFVRDTTWRALGRTISGAWKRNSTPAGPALEAASTVTATDAALEATVEGSDSESAEAEGSDSVTAAELAGATS